MKNIIDVAIVTQKKSGETVPLNVPTNIPIAEAMPDIKTNMPKPTDMKDMDNGFFRVLIMSAKTPIPASSNNTSIIKQMDM